MSATFVLSRARKVDLQRRVVQLSRAYNEVARELNGLSDNLVPFRPEFDIKAGETVMVRVPKRFRVRNT